MGERKEDNLERKKIHESGVCDDYFYGLEVDCDGYADWVVNPFILEVYGEEEYQWICAGRYLGMQMDI